MPSPAEKDVKTPNYFPQGESMQMLCDGSIRKPGEAYAVYAGNRSAQELPWPEIYFSTTITSGGYLRPADVDFANGMQANHDLARSLADDFIRQYDVDPKSVVLPSDLGKVQGWGQAEYLIFWFHVLQGARPEDAQALDKYFQTERFLSLTTVMENKLLPYDLRKQAYYELYKYVVTVAQNTEEGVSYDQLWVKKPRLIPLVDADYSLGCIGEDWWAGFKPYPKLSDVDLSKQTSDAVRAVQLLGASVMGKSYDKQQALLWAEYYDAELID